MKVIDAKRAILIFGSFAFKFLVNYVGGVFYRAHLIHARELYTTKTLIFDEIGMSRAIRGFGWQVRREFLDFERLREERLRLLYLRLRNQYTSTYYVCIGSYVY